MSELKFCGKMLIQKWRSFSELQPLDLFAEGVGTPTAKAIIAETRPPCNLTGRAGFLFAKNASKSIAHYTLPCKVRSPFGVKI